MKNYLLLNCSVLAALVVSASTGRCDTNSPPVTIIAAEYYIDNDPGEGKGTMLPANDGTYDSGIEEIDASIAITNNSPVGFHTLFVRFESSSNVWSVCRAIPFQITGTLPIVAAEYYLDSDPGAGNGFPIDLQAGNSPGDSILEFTVDTANLIPSFHKVFMRAKDAAGRWGVPYERTFEVGQPASLASAEYCMGEKIDSSSIWQALAATTGSFGSNVVTVGATIDTGGLSKGTQTVWIRATDSYGRVTESPAQLQFEVVNWPPIIGVIPDQIVFVGASLSYRVLATDPDGTNQTLRYSLGAGAPAGAAIDPQTGVFTWTPVGNPSTNIIKVQVNDGTSPNSRDVGSFTVFVEPAYGGDGPAVLSATGISESGRIGIRLSKPVDAASANLRDNYLVNGMKPDSAELQPDGRTVLLTLSSLFGESFTLHVSGLQDTLRRSMTGASDSTNSILTLRGVDLGSAADPIVPGSEIAVSSAEIQVSVGGSGFLGQADHGRFLYEKADGDFDVCVQVGRLAPTDFMASAGLMARAALSVGAKEVGLFLQPVGIDMSAGQSTNNLGYSIVPMARSADGGYASVYGRVATNMPDGNAWMRLRRQGDVFESFYGIDGKPWTSLGKTNLASANGFYLGLAASAANNGSGISTVARFLNYACISLWFAHNPQSQSAVIGSNVVFGVMARGLEPLQYQWLFNSAPIAGATNRLVTITNISAVNVGAYSVKVSNGAGVVTSDLAWLVLNDLAQGGFEGDIMPRPTGDNAVTISDWVEVGRMVVGLDQPTTVNEFKRVDCAPRSSLGDGMLTTADWVQAGRYAMGLDALNATGGPEQQSAKPQGLRRQMVAQSERWVVVGNAAGQPGTQVEVPIRLNALGGENGFGMSVVFDSGLLEYVGIASAVEGSILQANTAQIGRGRLGVAVVMPPGQEMGAGSQELARLQFRVLATGEALVSVSDNPVKSEVVSVEAEVLTSEFRGGVINAAAIKAGRMLELKTGGVVTLTGVPSADGEYDVWGSSDLVSWGYLDRVTASGGRMEFNDPATSGAEKRFYRLILRGSTTSK